MLLSKGSRFTVLFCFFVLVVLLLSQLVLTLSSDEETVDTPVIATEFQQSTSRDVFIPDRPTDDNRALCQGQEIEEDKTLLEEWIESFQSSIIRSIPQSDFECLFLWKNMSCEPSHQCTLKFKFGDYSLNRACRLRTCNDTTSRLPPIMKHFDDISKIASKSTAVVHYQLQKLVDKVKERAPPSDDLCSWSFKKLACIPSKYCSLSYKLGDYSLHRACRLKEDEDFITDNN